MVNASEVSTSSCSDSVILIVTEQVISESFRNSVD